MGVVTALVLAFALAARAADAPVDSGAGGFPPPATPPGEDATAPAPSSAAPAAPPTGTAADPAAPASTDPAATPGQPELRAPPGWTPPVPVDVTQFTPVEDATPSVEASGPLPAPDPRDSTEAVAAAALANRAADPGEALRDGTRAGAVIAGIGGVAVLGGGAALLAGTDGAVPAVLIGVGGVATVIGAYGGGISGAQLAEDGGGHTLGAAVALGAGSGAIVLAAGQLASWGRALPAEAFAAAEVGLLGAAAIGAILQGVEVGAFSAQVVPTPTGVGVTGAF
jgi:hypothetical protein